MNETLDVAFWVAVLLFALWQMVVGFAAVMNFMRVRELYGLTTTQKVFGYPTAAVYYTLDLALRLTLFLPMDYPKYRWVEFRGWGLPVPETVSRLLEREAKEGSGWRRATARWIRGDLLAAFDTTGGHGKPGR